MPGCPILGAPLFMAALIFMVCKHKILPRDNVKKYREIPDQHVEGDLKIVIDDIMVIMVIISSSGSPNLRNTTWLRVQMSRKTH